MQSATNGWYLPLSDAISITDAIPTPSDTSASASEWYKLYHTTHRWQMQSAFKLCHSASSLWMMPLIEAFRFWLTQSVSDTCVLVWVLLSPSDRYIPSQSDVALLWQILFASEWYNLPPTAAFNLRVMRDVALLCPMLSAFEFFNPIFLIDAFPFWPMHFPSDRCNLPLTDAFRLRAMSPTSGRCNSAS